MTKSELRKHILALRGSLIEVEKLQKSAAIARRLFAVPEYREAAKILFFVGFGSEVDTLPMIEQALKQGKTILAPKVIKGRRGEMELRQVGNPQTQLQPGAMGILEPDESCPIVPLERIDLIIVPAVAWDETGHRVGYGGGYYDRLLHRAADIPKVGIGFDCQMVAEVPRDAHDLGVGILITENRLLRFK